MEKVIIINKIKEETDEIFRPNAWYGFAAVVKQYSRWPFPLPFVVPHGVDLSKKTIWLNEIENELPAIFYFPIWRRLAYKNASKKRKILIKGCSPYLLINKSKIKRKLNTLVVFPTHSTHHITVRCNDAKYVNQLVKLKKNFSDIAVCLYWRDIELGRNKEYEKHNFKVISAGHMFSSKFIFSLHDIFSEFEFFHSNGFGSHLFYGCATGCKLLPLKIYKEQKNGTKTAKNRDISEPDQKIESKCLKIFCSKNFKKQHRFALSVLGSKYKSTPFQMFIIIFKTSLINKFFFKKALPHYFQNLFSKK